MNLTAKHLFGAYRELAAAGYAGAAASGGNAEDGERILQAAVDHVMPFLSALDQHGWQPGEWMRSWR